MPPSTPNQDYSFILKSPPPGAKSRLNLGSRGVFYLVGVLLVVLVIVLFLASRSKPQTEMIDTATQATEIARVSDLVGQTAVDADTKNLAATVSAAMNSEASQISSYLAASKIKLGAKQLSADRDISMDVKLATAAKNNSLDQTYYSYLKASLSKYSGLVANAQAHTGPKGHAILNTASQSIQTLLAAPALKSA